MRHHRSKVDFLYLLLLVVAIFMVDTAAMAAGLEAVARYYPLVSAAAYVAAVAFAAALMLLLYPVRYSIGADALHVRSGLLSWHVPLAHIHALRPALNMWPAPALSWQRLALEYSRGDRVRRLLVSPRDPEAFLADLVARDPGLCREGDGLIRRGGDLLRFRAGNLGREG